MADLIGQDDVHHLSCDQCAAPFTARARTTRYCSRLCKSRGYNATRKADGRLAAQRVRLADYNRAYLAEYRRAHLAPVPCAGCGSPVERGTQHRDGRRPSCSDWCRGYLRAGRWPSSEVPASHAIRSTPVPAAHPSRQRLRLRFIAGRCITCDQPFIVDTQQGYSKLNRYCRSRCARANERHLRRARTHAGPREVVSRHRVFERDKWTCQLCGKRVNRKATAPHPHAPTLDHVIPLSEGGEHTETNAQLAHFRCNTRKGNRGGGEQLALIG